MTQLVEQAKWKGRKGSSSRTLAVTLIDDDGYKHARSGIDVEQGHQCIFSYDGVELFRGIIMSQTQTQAKRSCNSRPTTTGFTSRTTRTRSATRTRRRATMFRDCCARFGLPVGEGGEAAATKSPELTKSKTTAFDAIADALSLDFDATGIRHYVASEQRVS